MYVYIKNKYNRFVVMLYIAVNLFYLNLCEQNLKIKFLKCYYLTTYFYLT